VAAATAAAGAAAARAQGAAQGDLRLAAAVARASAALEAAAVSAAVAAARAAARARAQGQPPEQGLFGPLSAAPAAPRRGGGGGGGGGGAAAVMAGDRLLLPTPASGAREGATPAGAAARERLHRLAAWFAAAHLRGRQAEGGHCAWAAAREALAAARAQTACHGPPDARRCKRLRVEEALAVAFEVTAVGAERA